ncbi:MAG: hypothetical protein OEY94_09425 [Alphaproteobacteria bacterium]|nr:hypothetical protein [Alphaproteobacteria bacterium]
MNAPIKRKRKNNKRDDAASPDMNMALIVSVVFHLVVVTLASVALPYFSRDFEPQEMAITVEMVDLADISQTNIVDKPNEVEEKLEEPKPPPAEKKPSYNKSESAPDLLEPKPPEIEEVAEEVPLPPKPEEVKPAPIEKKPAPPKPRNKPKPKPTPTKPKEEKKEEPERDISSLLRDVLEVEEEKQKSNQPDLSDDDSKQISQMANLSKELARSELDDLIRGIQPCWNVNAGGKYAEELAVLLRVYINPDMSVRKTDIIDMGRYNSDTHYRAAAEAARRALLNPRCNKLNLSKDKYEKWKSFTILFDPKDML